MSRKTHEEDSGAWKGWGVSIDLLLVTFNRLEYTRLTLESILADPQEEFRLTIWDNHSTDGTVEYLKQEVHDRRIVDMVLSRENLGPTNAINRVWSQSEADLVGKLDNDCLVTPGWTRTLARAHEDVPQLGAVACWHFREEDFDERLAAPKIHSFGRHRIFRHPYVCGSGFLMKRKTFTELGACEIGPDIGLTYYFVEMARRGYVNGWYYPLVLQDHMDDPFSKHTLLKTDEDIMRLKEITFNLRNRNIETIEQRIQWRQRVLQDLLGGPWDVKYYVGWRAKLRSLWKRAGRVIARAARKGTNAIESE